MEKAPCNQPTRQAWCLQHLDRATCTIALTLLLHLESVALFGAALESSALINLNKSRLQTYHLLFYTRKVLVKNWDHLSRSEVKRSLLLLCPRLLQARTLQSSMMSTSLRAASRKAVWLISFHAKVRPSSSLRFLSNTTNKNSP